MKSRSPNSTSTTGRARKAVAALLLVSLFIVPMVPMGSATDPSAFAVGVVSGSTVGTTSAVYNFTFTITDSDVEAVLLTMPAGFDLGATFDATNLPANYQDAPGTTTANFTQAASPLAAGAYYVQLSGTTVPKSAETYTATLSLFNGTAALNGTKTATFAVSALALGVELDDAHEEDIGLGSKATTDYYFDVSYNANFSVGDWFNVTFPSAFDLDDATVTGATTAISGQKAGYKFTLATDVDSNGVSIRVNDVVNPTVTTSTDYSFTARVMTEAGKTVATKTFTVTIVPPGLDITRTGGSTIIEEGDTEDDSITIALDTRPEEDVIVKLDGNGQITFDEDELTFDSDDWNTPQTVKLTAVDDNIVEGTDEFDIDFLTDSDDTNYDGLVDDFAVTILDNDAGLVLRHIDDETTVEEGDTEGDDYEVVLATKPTKSVTVTIVPESGVAVDDTELTFTSLNWDKPQEVTVTATRTDDKVFQQDQEVEIAHTTKSDDSKYDGLSEDLDVTITDDEHAALGLTEKQIENANKLVTLKLFEDGDDIRLEWDLPDQDELDDIFDSDGEITIQGIQILYSNSPYTLAETFEDGKDDEFDDGEWIHDVDDGATTRTKYLVTMYFDEDVGLWDDDNLPDTRDSAYGGEAIVNPVLPWWGWLIIGIVGVLIIGLILYFVIAGQNRRDFGASEWDEVDKASTKKAAPAKAASKAAPVAKKGPQKYDLECPVCDHHFAAKGTKPLKTECPNCGAKGVLN